MSDLVVWASEKLRDANGWPVALERDVSSFFGRKTFGVNPTSCSADREIEWSIQRQKEQMTI